MAQLRTVPGVASVEPDIWMAPVSAPVSAPASATPLTPPTNDTYAASMWGLMGPAQGSRYGIDAVDAWPLTTGQGVAVAVIDTGLLFDHPDLAGQSLPGYDLITDYGQGHTADVAGDGNGRDSDASDPGDWPRKSDGCGADVSSWHGTHVAGTIAAVANNSLGVFGGAPGVKVQPVRVLGHCGGYMSDVIDGIYWAAGSSQVGDGSGGLLPVNQYANCATSDPCVRVLNLSLGGPGGTCDADLEAAIQYALGQNKMVVAAAGNNDNNVRNFSPANCTGVFTVAATNFNGRRASFSNYGSATYPLVDIAAPGVGILSTLNSGTKGPSSTYNDTVCYYSRSSGCSYDFYDGTSMATPHVSLSAALVAAENPSLDVDQIEQILLSTATRFPYSSARHSCSRNANLCGAGIVNAAAAVAAAMPPATVPGPPTGVAASAGLGAIAVSWQPSADDGGREITGYEATVTRQADNSTYTCSTLGTLSCTVGSLANGNYMVTVQAQNAIGYGALSDLVGPISVPAVSPADTDPPTAFAPTLAIAGDQPTSGSIAVHVGWPAATDTGGPIDSYELQARLDGGAWSTVDLGSPAATSTDLSVRPGQTVDLRIAARDMAGNWSGWAHLASSPAKINLIQEKPTAHVVYSGRFRKFSFSGASGGHVRAAGHAGRKVTFTFTGSSVAFVSTLSPTRGIATVRLDGGAPQTIDLYHAGGYEMAQVAWSSGPLSAGPHTLVVTVTGTRNAASSRNRVDIDAFLTL